MSTGAQSGSSGGLSAKQRKVIVPKVWKRPHSTIYGKNVEFGSSLYSDKIGELNGRKFNSDLPWHLRNSGGGSSATSSSSTGASGGSQQGYLSHLLNEPQFTLTGSVLMSAGRGGGCRHDDDDDYTCRQYALVAPNYSSIKCRDYAHLLELTNPNAERLARERQRRRRFAPTGSLVVHGKGSSSSGGSCRNRIDFYDQFGSALNTQTGATCLLKDSPEIRQQMVDRFLNYDDELGLFVSRKTSGHYNHNDDDPKCLIGKKTIRDFAPNDYEYKLKKENRRNLTDTCDDLDINQMTLNQLNYPSHLIKTPHEHYVRSLPQHYCHLHKSPYGQSADGRKLSLGSINPHSYRPSLPTKTTTLQASDGEEFEFQDRSSPFYTDR